MKQNLLTGVEILVCVVLRFFFFFLCSGNLGFGGLYIVQDIVKLTSLIKERRYFEFWVSVGMRNKDWFVDWIGESMKL